MAKVTWLARFLVGLLNIAGEGIDDKTLRVNGLCFLLCRLGLDFAVVGLLLYLMMMMALFRVR